MRAFLLALTALFVVGCATTLPSNTTAVYDHKYNTYSFAKKSTPDDFVGTAAASVKGTPSWAPANTTAVYDRKYNTYSFVPK